MPLVKFQDAAGKPIQFLDVDGILYPYIEGADQDHSIPAVRNLKGRDDDVLLINYAKSGKALFLSFSPFMSSIP